MPMIYTIGHSDRPWDAFVALLQLNQIALLADIRSYPGSRHSPQFNRELMVMRLPQAGIRYCHLPDLGGRRKCLATSHNTAWRHPSFRGYADHMETPAFTQGIAELQAAARLQRVAYMCSESWHVRCHRSMVSDYLTSVGWQVWHIGDNARLEPHRYTQPARIVDGQLSYRGTTQQISLLT